jgi:hypothetical protein
MRLVGKSSSDGRRRQGSSRLDKLSGSMHAAATHISGRWHVIGRLEDSAHMEQAQPGGGGQHGQRDAIVKMGFDEIPCDARRRGPFVPPHVVGYKPLAGREQALESVNDCLFALGMIERWTSPGFTTQSEPVPATKWDRLRRKWLAPCSTQPMVQVSCVCSAKECRTNRA